MLMAARYCRTATTMSGEPWVAASTLEATKQPAARTALTAGPAMAIRNSTTGRFGSFAMEATPPNRNSVMPSTRTPNRRAVNAWPSSCRRTHVKSRRAAARPMRPYIAVGCPG